MSCFQLPTLEEQLLFTRLDGLNLKEYVSHKSMPFDSAMYDVAFIHQKIESMCESILTQIANSANHVNMGYAGNFTYRNVPFYVEFCQTLDSELNPDRIEATITHVAHKNELF